MSYYHWLKRSLEEYLQMRCLVSVAVNSLLVTRHWFVANLRLRSLAQELGQPILVRFGRRQDVEEEARASDEHPQELRAKLRMRTSDHFGGIVYQASDLPWERFAPSQESAWQGTQIGV